MTPLASPFAAGCVLLVVSGVVKLQRPSATGAALAGARLPSRPLLVRTWAGAEVAIGSCALLAGGEAGPAAVAVTYLLLAAFVIRAMRVESSQPCGCFGADESPPAGIHVLVDAAFAVGSAAVALGNWPGLGRVLDRQPGLGVPFAVLTAAIVFLAYTALTALPRALAAAERSS